MVEQQKITSRTRSLGFGWTNHPGGHGTQIAEPPGPICFGTPREIDAEFRRACRINNTAFWRCALYYRGEPIARGADDVRNTIDTLLTPNGVVEVQL